MDLLWDDNRPETCLSLGLDCRTCVHKSAATVASVTPGLGMAGAHQMFFHIFSSPGCAPMAIAFAQSYVDAEAASRRTTPALAIVAAA